MDILKTKILSKNRKTSKFGDHSRTLCSSNFLQEQRQEPRTYMGGFAVGLPPSKIDQREVPTRSKDICGSDIKIKKADHRLSPV